MNRQKNERTNIKITVLVILFMAFSIVQDLFANESEIHEHQLSTEQATAFDEFRRSDKNGRDLDQQISDFAIQSGVSLDAIRNHLGKGGKMSEEERREWEKGSDYKEQQRRIREKQRSVEIEQKRRASEARRQERKKVANAQTAALNKRREALVGKATLKEITKILGDAGVAKSFVSLRDRRKCGGKLTESEEVFFDEKARKIGIWMERKKMREASGPLHKEPKSTAQAQRDIDHALRGGRKPNRKSNKRGLR